MTIYDINAVSVADYRRRARRRLPRFMFDFVDGGANEENTLLANVADFNQFQLKQRVMRDVSNVDISTRLMGRECSMPVALAPVGFAGLMAQRGEALAARAAKRAGIPFTLSVMGICPLEEVQAELRQPFWFQLYMMRDRDFVLELLQRAETADVDTLVFTVDLAVPGMRQRDYRNGMVGTEIRNRLARGLQIMTSPHWAYHVGLRGRPHTFGSLLDRVKDPNNHDSVRAWVGSQFDTSVTWKDIRWLRRHWKGKLLIKGVLEADDARAAIDAGADGLIVSNHGGRQLDSVASSISMLPRVAEAVGDQTEVLLDGGIRSGLDVVKALSLGANGVLLGRSWVWAMAGCGESGLSKMLASFKQEMVIAMALCGVNRIEELSTEIISRDRQTF